MATTSSTPSPATQAVDSDRAAHWQLKEEGNKIFVARKYSAAYEKYSEALEVDHLNAVLYANRGACSFALQK